MIYKKLILRYSRSTYTLIYKKFFFKYLLSKIIDNLIFFTLQHRNQWMLGTHLRLELTTVVNVTTSNRFMDLSLNLGTGLEKVFWKTVSDPCCRSSLFITRMLSKRKARGNKTWHLCHNSSCQNEAEHNVELSQELHRWGYSFGDLGECGVLFHCYYSQVHSDP